MNWRNKQHSQIHSKYRQMAFRLARWRCCCELFENPWSNKSEWWPPEGGNPWNLLFSSWMVFEQNCLIQIHCAMWRSYFFCSFCQLSKKELESNPKGDWAEVLGGSLPISLCVGHLCGTFLVLLPATAQFDSSAQCKFLFNSVWFLFVCLVWTPSEKDEKSSREM